MVSSFLYILLALGSVSLGYLFYKFLLAFVFPRLQKRAVLSQRKEMLVEAKRQRNRILEEQKKLQETNLQVLEEDFEDELSLKKEGFAQQEKDLELEGERDVELEDKIIEREAQAASYQSKVEESSLELASLKVQLSESSEKMLEKMSQVAQVNRNSATKSLEESFVREKQVEVKKLEKQGLDFLTSASNKKALRLLDRVLSRYSPNFPWPKPINLVDVSRQEFFEKLNSPECKLLEGLEELSGVNITLISDEDKPNNHSIKVVGGYGIAKEASRLTLESLLSADGFSSWERFPSIYDSFFKKLTAEARVLGKKAVDQLGLKGIHPEIQKLVGALNWRTSYRQNQWYHTVEVATLAGLLAHELGVDPDAAKRVGLLHDIGKVLDYKINASHAIISADYADRYGESRIICDTVLSHHADLVVETPLAYILQTADCLSGARPGARVNLEEGYQIRLSAIQDAVHSFKGIADVAIMNGGREVHVQVVNRRVSEKALPDLAKKIAEKIEEMVNYPGKIKVMVTRTFESVKVA